jgi:hypothetical protein
MPKNAAALSSACRAGQRKLKAVTKAREKKRSALTQIRHLLRERKKTPQETAARSKQTWNDIKDPQPLDAQDSALTYSLTASNLKSQLSRPDMYMKKSCCLVQTMHISAPLMGQLMGHSDVDASAASVCFMEWREPEFR